MPYLARDHRREHFAASALCAAFLALLVVAGPAAHADELILYVSPDGNDSWPGRLQQPRDGDGPLASLAGARDRIRALRRKPDGLGDGVRVRLAEGTYRLAQTLCFRPEDSGSEKCPITYEAAPGAKALISGGRVITGWEKSSRVGQWRAQVPDVKVGKWHFRQLFVDGRRYVRARSPNEDDYWFLFEKIQSPEREGKVTCRKPDIRSWLKTDGLEAVVFRMWDISWLRVASFDRSKRLARFVVPKSEKWLGHWLPDKRYYLENSLAFLDSPGEWFLDREKGVVYLQPVDGHDMSKAEVVAPVVDRLLRFEGRPGRPVAHITFRGLVFRHAGWTLPEQGYNGHQGDVIVGGSIEGDYVESCAFRGCRFEQLGRYGLNLRRGCKNSVVEDCEFTDLGGGGVLIGDKNDPPGPERQTSGNKITQCHIHHCGKVWRGSTGIWVGFANHTLIARCHVHDVPCCGISVGWGWSCKPSSAHHNIVEYNRVHHAMMLMGDGAGIYTLNVQPGTVIRHNVVHDIRGYYAGGNGIYMDSSSGKMLVEKNLVCRTIHCSVVLGGARTIGSVVRNNIFALGGAERICGYGRHGRNHVFERNIVYLDREPLTFHWLEDTFRRIDYNLYHGASGRPVTFLKEMSFSEWQKSGRDVHSVMADPGFVNPKEGDFRLRPDSPALKLGFEPFDVEPVGPGPKGEWADPWASARLVELFNLRPRAHRTRRPPDPPPAMTAAPAKRKPVVDGRAGRVEWYGVPVVSLDNSPRGRSSIAGASRVRVCRDAARLYLLFESDVTYPRRLRLGSSRWGQTDGIEICLQDVRRAGRIVVLRGYPSGEAECARGMRAHYREEFRPSRLNVAYAAKITGKGWAAEWAIPFAELGIKIGKVPTLRFNVAVHHAASDERLVWVATGGSIWYVDRGGQLILRPKAGKRKQ